MDQKISPEVFAQLEELADLLSRMTEEQLALLNANLQALTAQQDCADKDGKA